MKKLTTVLVAFIFFFALTSCKKNTYESNYKFELFTDGIGFAMNAEKKYGYINEDFEVVIDFIYDDASAFYDGVALVELDDEFFLINTKVLFFFILHYLFHPFTNIFLPIVQSLQYSKMSAPFHM